jgi:hypothetical protein
MKNIFLTTWVKPAAGVLVAIGLAFSSLAFIPSAVFAQAPTPPTTSDPAKGEKRDAALEKAYAREQGALGQQQTHLDQLSEAAGKVEQLIRKAQQNGQDVSGLQAALSVFKAQLADAEKIHQTAAGILNAHKGFDGSGKVTDAALARQTVKDAAQTLRDAHVLIRQAAADLRSAVRSWRADHKQPKPTAVVPTPGSQQ